MNEVNNRVLETERVPLSKAAKELIRDVFTNDKFTFSAPLAPRVVEIQGWIESELAGSG